MRNKLIKRFSVKTIQAFLVAFVLVSTTAAVLGPQIVKAGEPRSSTPSNGTQAQEQKLTEDNQATLDENQPAPKLTHSIERDNLIKKLKLTNDANKVGFVYLMGANGQVVANYTVKGKVSSLNSLLTTTEQLRCASADSTSDKGCSAVTSPDLDGSYGDNPSGIFFFTTSGAYVEWSGTYLYADQALNITSAVTLIAPAS